MTITVTQEHIDKGVRGNFRDCSLAMAFKSAGFPEVTVGQSGVRPFGVDKDWFELPETAKEFRLSFDMGLNKVQPFSFDIEVPSC